MNEFNEKSSSLTSFSVESPLVSPSFSYVVFLFNIMHFMTEYEEKDRLEG